MLNGGEGINRLAGGVCLIIAPVVLLAGAIVHPSTHDDGAGHLAVVRDDPDRYFAAHAILLFGLALFLVAVLALFHIVRGRQALLGHLGGGLAIVGIVGSAAVVGTDGIVISQMGEPERNADEVAALLDAIKDSTRLRAIGGISGISFLLGMLSLAYGMWRSRAVSYWLAGGVAAAAVVFFIAQVTDEQPIFRIAFAIYALALIPIGLMVLAGSDEEWANAHARDAGGRSAEPNNAYLQG